MPSQPRRLNILKLSIGMPFFCLVSMFLSSNNLVQFFSLVPNAEPSSAAAMGGGKVQYVALANATRQEEYNHKPALLLSEVEKISHDPAEKKIIVHLFRKSDKQQRKCRNPRLFGRMSGPYATLIQWEPMTKTMNDTDQVNNRIIGHYSVPLPGQYFIEVIGLFCNNLQWNASFQHVCLEDPTSHRITDDTAFIDVVATDNSSLSASGYWKWSAPQDDQRPLLTRYQPQKCRSQGDLDDARCQVPMSRDQFSPYEFVYGRNNIVDNNSKHQDETSHAKSKLLKQGDTMPLLLCFVGLSHARQISNEVNLQLQERNLSSRVKAITIDAQFPRLVDPTKIARSGCSASVIAAGQWSAGRKPPGGRYRNLPPTLFPEYRREVRDMILRLRQSGLRHFHLRSIHYNALGDVKTTCPPQDWRSPPVIEQYNDIVSKLSVSMNVSYIDTNFIIGPLWDISEDFCHYMSDKVAKAESLYILSRLLPDEHFFPFINESFL